MLPTIASSEKHRPFDSPQPLLNIGCCLIVLAQGVQAIFIALFAPASLPIVPLFACSAFINGAILINFVDAALSLTKKDLSEKSVSVASVQSTIVWKKEKSLPPPPRPADPSSGRLPDSWKSLPENDPLRIDAEKMWKSAKTSIPFNESKPANSCKYLDKVRNILLEPLDISTSRES